MNIDPLSLLRLLLLVGVIALLPLSWLWLRQRGANPRIRLGALTALTLFLTFDLVVFGAFTRLSDSGLGCPDWPGCYGEASPLGAAADIHAAQSAMPSGPVSWSKAWIEMVHRYLAATVGVLSIVLAAASWPERQRLPHSIAWPMATLAWVVAQGLLGKYTVTLKLYPAVVTLHLLGGLGLLLMLARQHAAFVDRPLAMATPLRGLVSTAAAVLALQIVLGGWVSTNYAVLACSGFPSCNGEWWPAMHFAEGFTLMRELGRAGHGGLLSFEALVAIQMAHRLLAVVASVLLGWLALRLLQQPALRRFGLGLLLLLLAQWASGLSNVVLGWPLPAALSHSAGAAAFVLLLTLLLARTAPRSAQRALWPQRGTLAT
jgi:cytochrome c oxidase assembly protein subunit 15